MAEAALAPTACGIDSVEIARIERLVASTPPQDLDKLFSAHEQADAGNGPGRAASLAARFAAKEACVKLLPREAALGRITPSDFSVVRDAYGAPQAVASDAAEIALGRHRIASIALSLTHDRERASAVALARPATVEVPLAGKIIYRFLPFRRDVVIANLKRVFDDGIPEAEIVRLAQAHYGHLARLVAEFFRFRWLSHEQKAAMVRIENIDVMVAALAQGRGAMILTGHFGNWEVATIAGLDKYPQVRTRFHFVRRAVKPKWLDAIVTRRFERAGFGVLGKRGSLDAMLGVLERGDMIVFPFDQHAQPPDGIEADFFGQPAWTFKSLAIIALATGAPVIPASIWREPDGNHVMRFEAPVTAIECADTTEAIRQTTRAYNRALERLVLRHPEQWYWVHRRWKTVLRKRKKPHRAGAKP